MPKLKDRKVTLTCFHKQGNFVTTDSRLAMFSGGVGSGKTWAGSIRALDFMHRRAAGATGGIIAPTYRMLRDAVLPTFTNILDTCFIDYEFRKGDMEIAMSNGSLAVLRSADTPSHLRGPTWAWAWIDEPADCPNETGPIALGRLRDPGMPGMGYLWLTGTPRGRRNWVYKFTQDEAFELTLVKTVDNPHRPPGYLETLQRFYAGDYAAQELEGEFVEMLGLAYPTFAEANVSALADYDPAVPVFWAIDDGFTKDHPRVILFVHEMGEHTYHVFDEIYATYEVSEATIKRALSRNPFDAGGKSEAPYRRPECAYLDPSCAELSSRLWAMDVDTVRPSHRVEEGVKFLAGIVCGGDGRRNLLVHPRCVNLIREFRSYHRDDEGRLVKADDHGCFVAGTRVVTNQGQVPIEDIRPGDLVLTRAGFQPVAVSAEMGVEPTWVLELEDGTKLEGTADHPVWITGEFKPLGSLRSGDECLAKGTYVPVLRVYATGTSKVVYNLAVDNCHEYFANDVLVSNCDAIRYLTWGRRG